MTSSVNDTLTSAPLGRTGICLSRVGLGSFALGGADWVSSWGAQDDEDSVATIRHAVERGVTWIDTAAVYGLGHAEEVVARALAPFGDADRPTVFTKGGMVWDESDPRAPSRKVADEATLRGHVEASLRRLGVDALDVFFVHWPPAAEAVEEYWPVLLALQAEGKVKAVGLSNHSLEALERAEAIGHVDVVQPQFSAIVPDIAADVLPWARTHEVGVVVYSPMGSGLLTGAFDADRVARLPEGDWRRRNVQFTDRLGENLATADALAAVAERHAVPRAAAAVAWTLGFPGVTAAIVGARRPEQVEDWLPAAGLDLSAEDYASISPIIPGADPGAEPGTRAVAASSPA